MSQLTDDLMAIRDMTREFVRREVVAMGANQVV